MSRAACLGHEFVTSHLIIFLVTEWIRLTGADSRMRLQSDSAVTTESGSVRWPMAWHLTEWSQYCWLCEPCNYSSKTSLSILKLAATALWWHIKIESQTGVQLVMRVEHAPRSIAIMNRSVPTEIMSALDQGWNLNFKGLARPALPADASFVPYMLYLTIFGSGGTSIFILWRLESGEHQTSFVVCMMFPIFDSDMKM